MRLIDADKLEEFIDVGHLRSPCELCFSENDVIWIVRKRPTVDAVPVVHAHPIFEHGRNNAKCSNCGNYTIEYDMDNWDKYCSHCGAKMDEKVGEQDGKT